MSRLTFKEKYFSDESIGDESTDSETERRLDKTLLKSGTSSSNPIVLDEDDSVIVDEEVHVAPKKPKKKKNKKKKNKNKKAKDSEVADGNESASSSNVVVIDDDDDDNTANQSVIESAIDESVGEEAEERVVVPTSSWLGAFLQKKRTLEIMPPPEIEKSNDTYLRIFNEEFDHTEREEDSDDELPVGITAGDPFASTDKIDELAAEEETSTNTKLNFYNLPYSITEAELLQFGSKLGYSLTNVKIGFDKKKNLPSGSASAEIAGGPDVDINACVSALQGENCCGRPVRVQRAVSGSGDARRRLSGGKDNSRYFVNDITVKCQNCGEVGHKQFECTNEAIPTPCHLCAGKDHEAVNCPNITCFRCGQFGHHSRDCRNDRNSRPLFCSQCGSTTHDVKQCRVDEMTRSHKLDSRVEGRWIKCISCNQYGHVMCQSLPKAVTAPQYRGVHADVYCPNCGEKGHHIDYPAFDPNANGSYAGTCCKAPKYEAFVKFPKLLENTDGKSGAEKNEYYREILRNASFNDRQLFPSLNYISSGGGGGASSGGGGGGGISGSYQPVRNGITYNDGPTFEGRQSGGSYRNSSSGGGSNRHDTRRDDHYRGASSGGGQKRKHRDYSDDEEEEVGRRPVKTSRFGPDGGGGRRVYQDNHEQQQSQRRWDNEEDANFDNDRRRRQSHGGNSSSGGRVGFEGSGRDQYNSSGRDYRNLIGGGGGGYGREVFQNQARQRHSYSGGERIHNVRDTVKEEFDAKSAARKSRFG